MKKEKDFENSQLFAIYGKALTEKQQNMLTSYYDFDCSLSEIAEESGISRQAVRDSIKKAEQALIGFESQFGFFKKQNLLLEKLQQIKQQLGQQAECCEIQKLVLQCEGILEDN